MGLLERIADPDDPLRAHLVTAQKWGVPPTLFLRERTTGGPWTDQDTAYAMALAAYETRLCPRGHDTAETLQQANSDAYRGVTIGECQKCVAVDIEIRRWDEHKRAQALLFGVEGPDPDVVAANRELIAASGGDPTAALAPKPPDPEDSPQQKKESQA